MDDSGDGTPPRDVPRLARGERRPEVEAELESWYALDSEHRASLLRAAVDGTRMFKFETYVHICRQAFAAGDRKLVNLAFEALAKAATPLLLYQAKGEEEVARGPQGSGAADSPGGFRGDTIR